MLLKIKAIVAFAVFSAVAGLLASLAGADYITAFGPSIGAIVSGGIGYGVKESLPLIRIYIGKAFGVTIPTEEG